MPGDNDDIQELQSRYELDEYCSRDFVDGAPKKARMRAAYDVHVWGSFLKGWIRSLKDPIITEDCYDEAIQIIGGDAADADVVAQLQALLAKLPLPHATLVRHLTTFLSRCVQPAAHSIFCHTCVSRPAVSCCRSILQLACTNGQVRLAASLGFPAAHCNHRVDPVASKMNAENLAIVFAPCLLRHPDLMVRGAPHSCVSLECLKQLVFLLILSGVYVCLYRSRSRTPVRRSPSRNF